MYATKPVIKQNALTPSEIHSYIPGRGIKAFNNFALDSKNPQTALNTVRALDKMGISLGDVYDMMATMDSARRKLNVGTKYAQDSIQPTVTAPSIITVVQFLQEWLPGFVDVVTQVRMIDEFIGIMTAGSWEDEQIVQPARELTNKPAIYGDYTVVPLASSNYNFVTRSVVRFEQGTRVSRLDEARAARIRADLAGDGRESCALGLEIVRNEIGFYGFNGGANYTYGFLNDPNLLAYNTVAAGTSGHTQWVDKTTLEIIADLLQMLSGLRVQSGGVINPKQTKLTLAVGLADVDYLATVTTLGFSALDWLGRNYPNVRVVSAPELDGANAGANVGYLFADSLKDTSSDGGQTFIQVVPQKFLVLGVQQLTKGYEEDYSNATAGTMCKRPFAVYRVTGI